MTQFDTPKTTKPRIAIMGEFSAGKSTLCNLLLRFRPLPERVTATRLAPVWMTQGPGQHVRVTLDGDEEPVSLELLDTVPVENTRYVRLFLEADILELCDFIDFPGISDPNMDAEVWERVLVEADAVIWLTHATQAWRQSEAAVWDSVPERVRQNSILLVTRFDKLVTDEDRARVLARLDKEAAGLFDRVFPISLTDALAAQDDYDAWTASGAGALIDHLAGLIARLAQERAPAQKARPGLSSVAHGAPAMSASTEPATVTADPIEAPAARPSAPPLPDMSGIGPAAPKVVEPIRIVPRRVKPSGAPRRERPSAINL